MERQAAVQATLEGRKASSGGESLASRIVQIALERALTSTAMPSDTASSAATTASASSTASTTAAPSTKSTPTATSPSTTTRAPTTTSTTTRPTTTARGTSTRSATPRAVSSRGRTTTTARATASTSTSTSTTTTSTTTATPDVDGPLDIPLGVPAEPAGGEPSTSKPGSKISLWVVPHGEDDGDKADAPTLSQVPHVSSSYQTDDEAGASVRLGIGQNRVAPKSKSSSSSPRPKALNPAAGDAPDLDDTLAFLSPPSSQITSAAAASLPVKKTPETPQLDEHSHDHDAEDAALFASLLMAPGSAGHGLTGPQQQLQILQAALGSGANLNDPRTKERLASLLAALVVARTRAGGGTGTPGVKALGATALRANPTLSSPSPSPTAAADAALLSALLGAGGGHGLGGPFGGRPVSSTEQTLRDQALITELLRAGQQQPPPSRSRSRQRPSTTSSTSAPAVGDAEASADSNATTPTSAASEAPVTKRQRKRPASSTPRPTDFRGLFGFQDPPRGATSDIGGEEPGRDQPLVTAAINVTRAVSQFMGLVIQGAANSFQSFVRQRTNGLANLFNNWGAGSG
ncbi:mucin-5AC-like isoform X2 [Frankliniella occidentalis]|uniref:Mucin-5AC-like isoform X2 n=1 Tax=Frankliniella occidentalis TaxID=133901 RepID=A0A9C6X3W5_FRAOC|nr:mucin-5AC-like isoform X2 [Frankliniella occidentalis]